VNRIEQELWGDVGDTICRFFIALSMLYFAARLAFSGSWGV
jgi:hypothetical protein